MGGICTLEKARERSLTRAELEKLARVNPWVAERGVMAMNISDECRKKLVHEAKLRQDKELTRLIEYELPRARAIKRSRAVSRAARKKKFAAALAKALR